VFSGESMVMSRSVSYHIGEAWTTLG
jgi:hypothetical protein